MKQSVSIEDSAKYLMDTYRRQPRLLRKGRGVKVWDSEDREYLDFVGGVATDVLGHCPPKVVMAIQKQAQRLLHVSNHFHIGQQIKLAKLLVANSFASRVFFCNSGTEAIEGAIKLARKFGHEQGRYEIITALGSFHGRTLGALAATGQEKLKKGFEPMPAGFVLVPFGDISALASAINKRTAAVMLEPVLGEGGVVVPPKGYLETVRKLCTEQAVLLILDEIQTGIGRTGTLFAYEQFGITPDIMALAKGLGGGVPIGAVLATEAAASAFKPGDHGSTFGGNPLACAAGLATMEAVLENGLVLDQCRRMGAHLMKRLDVLRQKYPSKVTEVRGMGLLVGVELSFECADVIALCMEKGLLVNCTAQRVVRFMPPLIVQEPEIDQAVDILDAALKEI